MVEPKPTSWARIAAATAVASAGFWVAGWSGSTPSFILAALAVVVAVVVVSGTGTAEDLQAGVRAATAAMVVATVLVVLFGITGNVAIALLVPPGALGVGGTSGLSPRRDPKHITARTTAVAVCAVVVVMLAAVAPLLSGVLSPVLPLPAVAVADLVVMRRLPG